MSNRSQNGMQSSAEFKLLYGSGSNEAKSWHIFNNATIIGKGRGCDIVLDSPEISSIHCVLTHNASVFFLRDCKSRSGIRVNGEKFSAGQLQDEDIVQIGTFSFQIFIHSNNKNAKSDHEMLKKRRKKNLQLALKHRAKFMELRQRLNRDHNAFDNNYLEEELAEKKRQLYQRLADVETRSEELTLMEKELEADRNLLNKEMSSFRDEIFQKEKEIQDKQGLLKKERKELQEELAKTVAKKEKYEKRYDDLAKWEESLSDREAQLQAAWQDLKQRQALGDLQSHPDIELADDLSEEELARDLVSRRKEFDEELQRLRAEFEEEIASRKQQLEAELQARHDQFKEEMDLKADSLEMSNDVSEEELSNTRTLEELEEEFTRTHASLQDLWQSAGEVELDDEIEEDLESTRPIRPEDLAGLLDEETKKPANNGQVSNETGLDRPLSLPSLPYTKEDINSLPDHFSKEEVRELILRRHELDFYGRFLFQAQTKINAQREELVAIQAELERERARLSDNDTAISKEKWQEQFAQEIEQLEMREKLVSDSEQLLKKHREALTEMLSEYHQLNETCQLMDQNWAGLREENQRLNQLLEQQSHQVEETENKSELLREIESLQRDNEILRQLLSEKDRILEELQNNAVVSLQSMPAVEDVDSYEAELVQFRRQLEADRLVLNQEIQMVRQRNKELEDQTRDCEMEFSRERAQLARERLALERMRSEIQDDLERLQRDAGINGRLASVQQLRQQIVDNRQQTHTTQRDSTRSLSKSQLRKNL